MRRLLFALPFALLPLAAAHAAHDEHEHHDEHASLAAHEHGAAQLNVALEGQRLELALESPAMNLVGFEHAAVSTSDKAAVARWTRTLSTMFAAGVPLVEALDSVGGAAGNAVYAMATDKIQQEVSTGTSLTAAMGNANVFPSMVLQMCAIGEESGSIDHMLGKAADFYEAEVDDMVAGLSSLMEPIIIVFLGTLIGGIVVSMYLPIFKLGQVV